ncbi:hypothetical protein BDN72DRAFT_851763 [Pluteus cervinus]|uniref:Uncharacterized protein n=1 Tax=Pluteus cervinus TaxID=181527 RepID=A0ACD2ZY77_9AGAR|nr:hypothetical protein BDN72DRAFT_851763 [Pluteus cervinus]
MFRSVPLSGSHLAAIDIISSVDMHSTDTLRSLQVAVNPLLDTQDHNPLLLAQRSMDPKVRNPGPRKSSETRTEPIGRPYSTQSWRKRVCSVSSQLKHECSFGLPRLFSGRFNKDSTICYTQLTLTKVWKNQNLEYRWMSATADQKYRQVAELLRVAHNRQSVPITPQPSPACT